MDRQDLSNMQLKKSNFKMIAKVRIQEFFFYTKSAKLMNLEPHETMYVLMLASLLHAMF